MSDLDDLEDIAEQQRFGVNEPSHGMAKGNRISFHRAQKRGGKENRSVDKQQYRSADRRRSVVKLANQD
jgi:hypothetical protein